MSSSGKLRILMGLALSAGALFLGACENIPDPVDPVEGEGPATVSDVQDQLGITLQDRYVCLLYTSDAADDYLTV